jgi:hypothetical protein
MTEDQWLACTTPWGILGSLSHSPRKQRLFGCACCRRLWPIIGKDLRGRLVELAERVADGLADRSELNRTIGQLGQSDSAGAAVRCLLQSSRLAATAALEAACAIAATDKYNWRAAEKRETVEQAGLLRHIAGNPFRPSAGLATWPTAVVQLSESLYAGTDCAFALHDALLEVGHADLAAHFGTEAWHPKGCWALDLILAKK